MREGGYCRDSKVGSRERRNARHWISTLRLQKCLVICFYLFWCPTNPNSSSQGIWNHRSFFSQSNVTLRSEICFSIKLLEHNKEIAFHPCGHVFWTFKNCPITIWHISTPLSSDGNKYINVKYTKKRRKKCKYTFLFCIPKCLNITTYVTTTVETGRTNLNTGKWYINGFGKNKS